MFVSKFVIRLKSKSAGAGKKAGKKAGKDPNKPKRPASAFFVFMYALHIFCPNFFFPFLCGDFCI